MLNALSRLSGHNYRHRAGNAIPDKVGELLLNATNHEG
jgi:hypothetical protein